MSIVSYWPEMGERKLGTFDGNVSFTGDYNFIQTPHALKGRGITFLRTYRSSELTERGQYKAGWNSYRVTDKALAKLLERFTFIREALLD